MSADLVLVHAEDAETEFLIYTGNFCGYCNALKRLLGGLSLTYTEYNFDEHEGLRKLIVAATGHRTVPVVFDLREEDPRFIGGFDETKRYLK
ncbi:MAG TPA: glutaredoxin [Candidatus Poseidoniaceae archaeon]|nr:glutaredoxin [Candidatus Poseidoniaceae archaeon]